MIAINLSHNKYAEFEEWHDWGVKIVFTMSQSQKKFIEHKFPMNT